MPFSEEARERMLRLMFLERGDDFSLRIGWDDVPLAGEPQMVEWEWQDGVITNRTEVTCPRAQGEYQVTQWFVSDENQRTVAFDKLERPILLRKGERATFPAGSLRLELR